MEKNTRVNTWQPTSKTEDYIRKYRKIPNRKYVNAWQRNERLAGLADRNKRKAKNTSGSTTGGGAASTAPADSSTASTPRQEQEQAEQKGQPWHERLVPVDGRLWRQKLPSSERGQNDNDRGKTREFKQRDRKASYLPRRRRARRNRKDIAQIPWCANYVCSENSFLSLLTSFL